MLTLLALACAGTPASTGCFCGGAFVGAQAGFTRITLKKEAKAKAISKDDAGKLFDNITSSLKDAASYTAVTKADADTTKVDAKVKLVRVDVKSGDDAATINKAVSKALEGFTTTDGISALKGFDSVKVIVAGDTTAPAAFDATAKTAVVADVTKNINTLKRDDVVKSIVAADAETKYTSNNGFAGLHAGYLGRVNDKFLFGGLVEGNWVFGQDMKNDQTSQDEKDTKARFNASAYLRAMFSLTEKFMAGADLGFSGQEIRQLKEVGKTDKESKWFWNPAARLVLGVALTDNVLATAHFGGVFPMIKQDSLKDASVKAKYSNFHGGVGISYVFGG